MPVLWDTFMLFSSPFILFWIIIPVIPYSPVHLLSYLGVSYEIAVILSLIFVSLVFMLVGVLQARVVHK